MRYLFPTIILSVLISGLLHAQDTPQTIHDYYRETRARILVESRQDRETLSESYAKNLAAARDYYRDNGDLMNTLIAKRELQRFQNNPTPPDEIPDKIDTKLKRFFQTFRVKWHEIKAEEYRKRIALCKKYAAHLEDLEKTLTRQDKLDRALEIHEQRKKLQQKLTDLKNSLTALPKPEIPPRPSELRTRNSERGTPLSRIPLGLRKHLVAYYTFDEPGPKVIDHSGNGHHGTVHGAKWVRDGKVGGCYEFDGKDDWIDLGKGTISKAIDGAKAVTVAMWVKSKPISGKVEQTLLAGHATAGRKSAVYISLPDEQTLRFGGRSRPDDSFQGLRTSVDFQNNTWILITGVLDFESNAIILYVDKKRHGKEQVNFGSDRCEYDMKQTYKDYIGTFHPTERPFTGRIDQVAVFNTTVTPDRLY